MTHPLPKLLLDEHVWQGLAAVLVETGYDVLHIIDTGQHGIADEDVLALATSQERAVLTYNTRHFVPLARQWYEASREHCRIILSIQVSQGVLLSSVRSLLETLSGEELHNTVRWLQEFSGLEHAPA